MPLKPKLNVNELINLVRMAEGKVPRDTAKIRYLNDLLKVKQRNNRN